MAEFPSLEIFTDAYLADTGDLSLEEHGAYHLMLYVAWRRPDNALPNDLDWLRRALAAHCASLHGNRFNAIVPRLLERFWFLSTDPSTGRDSWKQKRLEKERDFRRKFSETQRDRINKRWSDHRKNKDLADTAVIPAGNTPHPTLPVEVSKNLFNVPPNKSVLGGNGGPGKTGAYPQGSVTLDDPEERVARFQATLANYLIHQGNPAAWDIVVDAFNPNATNHRSALALCKRTASAMGKGWPHPRPPPQKANSP